MNSSAAVGPLSREDRAPTIPFIPDTAPFTPAQRAYLNGFFAGLFSRTLPAALAQQDSAKQAVTILFGSQTGTAEALAKRIAREAKGFAPSIFDLAQYPPENLKREKRVLLVTSTYGDGDPPDNAKAFWEWLNSEAAPPLTDLRFSVLALGDSNYPKFCECGKNFDDRLEALGGQRMHPRVDCDLDYEAPFQSWLQGVLTVLSGAQELSPRPSPSLIAAEGAPNGGEGKIDLTCRAPQTYSRSNPFPARLITNRLLNAPGSEKETRHFEIALENSGLSYEAGDAIGVVPTNCPDLVQDLLSALGCSGNEPVPGKDGSQHSLREALLHDYEITRIGPAFLTAASEKTGDPLLVKLAAPGVNGELTEFLRGREVIDLLTGFPNLNFAPAEFIGLLKKLQPRLYSISSSPKAHAGQVHLTVRIVRYFSEGRPRKGVCSSFLADRAQQDTSVPIFVHTNKNFRPPGGFECPMIMVGPGTGIAPFRAFLEERRAVGAPGRNWLFFGEQREKTDFLYRDEMEGMLREGSLTRLQVAFSRDREQKSYVQHRLLEHAREVFAWLEEGAHFYVCGDASRMARDVDAALHRVIEIGGARTSEQAAEYVRLLKSQKRYQRDVY